MSRLCEIRGEGQSGCVCYMKGRERATVDVCVGFATER